MYHFYNSFRLNIPIIAVCLIAGGLANISVAQTTASDTASDMGTLESENAPLLLTFEDKYAHALQQSFADGGEALAAFGEFYAARDNQPIWTDGNAKTILEFLTAVEQAPAHGLSLQRYNTTKIETLWANAFTPEDLAALESAIAQSYVLFAKDLTAGMLNPKTIDKEMNAAWRVPDTAVVLANAANTSDLKAFYKTLGPSSAEYSVLLAEKQRLEQLISADINGALVPSGKTLRPGQSHDRVIALRLRLNKLGYNVNDRASTEYNDDIIEAVKAFQADSGLNTDGLVGPQTLAAINAGPEQHLKQIIVNLERLRWMNFDLGARHIYVNIPDYTASVIDNGTSTLSFRVVVGKGRFQTAEFSDVMTHMVINPTWHVPYSIASKEYLPKLQNDPTVLARQNIQMLVRGSGQVVDSTMIDYSQYTQNDFPFILRQRPGSYNALGRVKFMFPNKYNIYLHDTPSRSLFARDARAFSHGCVRVQKPLELAYTLLSLQEADPQTLFENIRSTRRETQVDLDQPIPVHLVYRTVWAEQDGTLQYRADVYRRDRLVFDALVQAGVTIPTIDS